MTGKILDLNPMLDARAKAEGRRFKADTQRPSLHEPPKFMKYIGRTRTEVNPTGELLMQDDICTQTRKLELGCDVFEIEGGRRVGVVNIALQPIFDLENEVWGYFISDVGRRQNFLFAAMYEGLDYAFKVYRKSKCQYEVPAGRQIGRYLPINLSFVSSAAESKEEIRAALDDLGCSYLLTNIEEESQIARVEISGKEEFMGVWAFTDNGRVLQSQRLLGVLPESNYRRIKRDVAAESVKALLAKAKGKTLSLEGERIRALWEAASQMPELEPLD